MSTVPLHIPPRLAPAVTLKPHQVEAARFLEEALSAPDGFAILGDDMGMGKTLVAMEVLLRLVGNEDTDGGGAAVVLTTRVILEEVWRPHFQQFAPSARVHVVGGPPEDRDEEVARAVSRAHVVLCTATMAGAMQARAGTWAAATAAARLVVVDECQYMTNPESQLWQAVRARSATPVLLMSGTPFHNQACRQLRALCDAAAAPGTPLRNTQLTSGEFLAAWEERRAQVLLRRTAAELAAADVSMRRTAPRQQNEICEFSETQARLYHAAHRKMMRKFHKLQRARQLQNPLAATGCLRAYQAALTTLRVVATHPCISDVSCGDMQASAVALRHAKTKRGISVKLHMTLRFIQAQGVQRGRKVVVVSAFRCFLDILAEYLADRGIPFTSFTGAVRGAVRSAQLAQWKGYDHGINVLLMTTKCGNAGISLDPDPHPDGQTHTTLVLDVDSMSELNPATRAQLLMRWNRRMRAPGQPPQDTLVVSLVVRGTTDDIQDYLAAKHDGTAAVLGKRKQRQDDTKEERPPQAVTLARVLDRAWSGTRACREMMMRQTKR